MTIMTKRTYLPAFAHFALATLLLAGCASVAKSEPPAETPTAVSKLPARPAVESGDELEPSGVRSSTREREQTVPRRTTMKGFKSFDLSPRGATEDEHGAPGSSAVPGAVAAVAVLPVPAVFAERQASEALDRLASVVTIRHEKRGAVITLASDRLVESGQWALTTSGEYNLRELAVGLRDQAGRTIIIQGYTDSMGSPAVNDALSLRRAEAVRDFLITQGVGDEKMRVEGLGARRPVANNGSADGRAQNRRIEIVLVPFERDNGGR